MFNLFNKKESKKDFFARHEKERNYLELLQKANFFSYLCVRNTYFFNNKVPESKDYLIFMLKDERTFTIISNDCIITLNTKLHMTDIFKCITYFGDFNKENFSKQCSLYIKTKNQIHSYTEVVQGNPVMGAIFGSALGGTSGAIIGALANAQPEVKTHYYKSSDLYYFIVQSLPIYIINSIFIGKEFAQKLNGFKDVFPGFSYDAHISALKSLFGEGKRRFEDESKKFTPEKFNTSIDCMQAGYYSVGFDKVLENIYFIDGEALHNEAKTCAIIAYFNNVFFS